VHGQGDECLSFHLAPAVVDAIGGRTEVWRTGGVPPLPELVVLGELAQAGPVTIPSPRRAPPARSAARPCRC
jgi:hypothetical protein